MTISYKKKKNHCLSEHFKKASEISSLDLEMKNP